MLGLKQTMLVKGAPEIPLRRREWYQEYFSDENFGKIRFDIFSIDCLVIFDLIEFNSVLEDGFGTIDT